MNGELTFPLKSGMGWEASHGWIARRVLIAFLSNDSWCRRVHMERRGGGRDAEGETKPPAQERGAKPGASLWGHFPLDPGAAASPVCRWITRAGTPGSLGAAGDNPKLWRQRGVSPSPGVTEVPEGSSSFIGVSPHRNRSGLPKTAPGLGKRNEKRRKRRGACPSWGRTTPGPCSEPFAAAPLWPPGRGHGLGTLHT